MIDIAVLSIERPIKSDIQVNQDKTKDNNDIMQKIPEFISWTCVKGKSFPRIDIPS